MQSRTLPELATELERQANAKKDYLGPVCHMKLRTNGHSELVLNGATNQSFSLNDVAHGQVADYTGVPKQFYDRLRGKTGELTVAVWDERHEYEDQNAPLFDVLVNKLLWSKSQDVRLVRTLDGTARAFLSNSFNPDLDHLDVYRVLAGVMRESELGPENVVSAEVTDRKLYIKVVSPKLQAEIRPENLTGRHGNHYFLREPQTVQAGFILTNSETGQGSLCIQQVVYKLVCTNMWIKEEAVRQRHIGKTLEADEGGVLYRDDTRAAEAKARLLKIRDHVADALDPRRFQQTVSLMQGATEIRLEGSVEKVVEVTARKFGLSQTEKDDVLKNLIEGADLSLWGLTNAVTAAAHTAESYDRATELEMIGGRMLSLPRADITDIALAA